MSCCVVIGAGPAGLATAWWLEKLGIRAIVLEAEPWVGGRTRSVRIEGSTINTGAAFFASFYDETLALCDDLKLPLARPLIHPIRAKNLRHMMTPNGSYPLGGSRFANVLRFPLVPMSQKIRFLKTMLGLALGPRLHIAEPSSLAPFDNESASRWAQRSIGAAAYHYFVRPAVEPFFYMEASEVSEAVARALLRHAIRWHLLSPRQGVGAFCDQLAAKLDCRVRCRVDAIEELADKFRAHYGGSVVDADAVVIAIPPGNALELVAPYEGEDGASLRSVKYEANIAVFFGYDRPLDLNPPSITLGGPGRHSLVGITALSRGGVPGMIADGKEVVAVLAMGWRSRQLMGRSDSEIVDALMDDLRALNIDLPPPAWTFVCPRKYATVIPEPGYFKRITAFAERRRHGIHFAGDWLSGNSTVEGAVRSGRLAAQAVLRDLNPARSPEQR